MASTKFAISLPEEVFRAVELERKRRGLSRSAVVQTGLLAWLQAQRLQKRTQQYVKAYRARPETDREVVEAAELVRATGFGRSDH
jgi:metal-responsive CopG/Arc/MetJ family transcriptional regulator